MNSNEFSKNSNGASENRITYFAHTDARNKQVPFGIKAKDRTRHVYVIGKTGMGKSTLLENMAIQDIQNGEGLAFIDPHGKTAEYLLDFVPEHRIKDVLYFAPFDLENPIAFNVMEDVGADKRHLVVAGLMSAFEKIWIDAWSARMAYILQNTLHALLEYPGATLLGVNKMLTDKEYRKKVVDNVSDPTVKSFWTDEFAKYTDRYTADATPAIQNKVGQFTSNPLIRNIIGQPHSSFDIRKIMDEKKILIINLSKGLVGENNANLLGSMLVTKIYLAAMSRADVSEKSMIKLPNFYLHVDEFQSFANKSFADILSEARKYKLNLTIAHQYIEQMEEEVRDAVFGNVGTTIAFRVGAFDAEVLEKEFAPVFMAEDLVNLGFAQVYLKLMIDGVGSQPFSAKTMGPITKTTSSYKRLILASSREQFSFPRSQVESVISEQLISKVETRTEKKPREEMFSGVQSELQKRDEKRKGVENREKSTSVNKPEGHLSELRQTLAGVMGADLSKSENKSSPKLEVKSQPQSHKPKENPRREVKNEGMSDHKKALAEVLAKLQEKEKKSVSEEKEAEESFNKKEISEKELRDMLHVDNEGN
ncbi:MAG: type IV secretion system DNA-binding domain-containing protein [Patescibacteria group bacterium]